MPFIAEIYITCAILGALALAFSALMGGFGHLHTGHAVHIGHLPAAHGGHIGHSAAGQGGQTGQITSGHSTGIRAAHASAGHALSGQRATPGSPQTPAPRASSGSGQTAGHSGGTAGSQGTQGHSAALRHPGASTTSGHQASNPGEQAAAQLPNLKSNIVPNTSDRPGPLLSALLLFNPMTFSTFTLWFGACGLFTWRLLPVFPIAWTTPVALAGGLLGTKLTLQLMGSLLSNMHSSGSFSQDSLIGLPAEVTVPVEKDRTGEITCIAGGPRYNFSARSLDGLSLFKRGCSVIISDIKDGVAYVEEYPDGQDVLTTQESCSAPLKITLSEKSAAADQEKGLNYRGEHLLQLPLPARLDR